MEVVVRAFSQGDELRRIEIWPNYPVGQAMSKLPKLTYAVGETAENSMSVAPSR